LHKVCVRGRKRKAAALSQFKISGVVGCELVPFGKREDFVEGAVSYLVVIDLRAKACKLPGVVEKFLPRNMPSP